MYSVTFLQQENALDKRALSYKYSFLIAMTLSTICRSVIDIYVELESREYMGEFIEFMRDSGLSMSNLQMEPDYLGTNSINSVAFVVTVRSLEHRPHDSMIDTLRHIPHLKFIEEL